MAIQKVNLKFKCYYNGHDIKKSGLVSLKIISDYSELVNVVPLIQLLNNHIKIGAIIPGKEKALTIGTFMLNNIKINSDGTSSIQLNSTIDSTNLNNINELTSELKDELTILVRGEIELGGNDDE